MNTPAMSDGKGRYLETNRTSKVFYLANLLPTPRFVDMFSQGIYRLSKKIWSFVFDPTICHLTDNAAGL